eukprot:468898-Amphidinium_carterae.1
MPQRRTLSARPPQSTRRRRHNAVEGRAHSHSLTIRAKCATMVLGAMCRKRLRGNFTRMWGAVRHTARFPRSGGKENSVCYSKQVCLTNLSFFLTACFECSSLPISSSRTESSLTLGSYSHSSPFSRWVLSNLMQPMTSTHTADLHE